MVLDKQRIKALNYLEKKIVSFFEYRKRKIYIRRFNETREAWIKRQVLSMDKEID